MESNPDECKPLPGDSTEGEPSASPAAATPGETVHYKRSRFTARLPRRLRYTASHFWLDRLDGSEDARGRPLWRVGFTRFAARMLGELVEFGFEVKPADPVQVGQVIGWVEAFKAVTDVFCVIEGAFAGPNEELQRDPALAQSDPFGRGWLYAARGTPEPDSVDVDGYVAVLDGAIDKIQGKTS